MSTKQTWQVVEESADLFTEFLDLGFSGYIRTYSWDNDRDCASCMSMSKLDHKDLIEIRKLAK